MSGFDVEAGLRWLRRLPTRTLARRPDAQLPFIDQVANAGQGLLLDTCVYIDRLQGKAPDKLMQVMAARLNHHSSVAVQELAHTLGVLNPADARTASVQRAITELLASMPDHRVLAADMDVLGRAAILNGVICRIQGYGDDRKLRCLSDCTLYLQAMKHGLVLLTRNIADYDLCQQLVRQGRVLFYRV